MILYEEREARIMQQLQLQPVVKVGELSRMLRVSVDTIRRDLKAMEQKGLIKYVHGGATLPEGLSPFLSFSGREIIHSDLKREAAVKALPLIRRGDVVALNSGTTNMLLAQEMLRLEMEFTVVTNNLAAVGLLMQSSRIHVIAIGGEVDNEERSTYGVVCEREFSQYFPDITFLAVNAVNYTDGFTDFRFHEMEIMKQLAGLSVHVYALMDSSKLGRRSKKKVLDGSELDGVIMDDHVTDHIRSQYENHGIHIL